MSQQGGQSVGWRARVKLWLGSVQRQRNMYGVDLGTAASQQQTSFPRNALLLVISRVTRGLALWLVRSALRDAATELGITLTDTELDVVANLAVAALAA